MDYVLKDIQFTLEVDHGVLVICGHAFWQLGMVVQSPPNSLKLENRDEPK